MPASAVAATLLSPAPNSAQAEPGTSPFAHLSENTFQIASRGATTAAALAGGEGNALTGSKTSTAPAARETAPAPEATAAPERGRALPGDRGPREKAAEPAPQQRPSFWRRIALGRRGNQERTERAAEPPPLERKAAPNAADRAAKQASNPIPAAAHPSAATTAGTGTTPPEGHSAVRNADAPALAQEMLEKRVVEPMLQALVSVEAKLERSHADLTGRSDQVEQRLTQLWDIEEQLGTLSELQESLLQVSEQQRRLENALVAQTRSLRWLIGGVFFAITAAAFVVAAVLR